MTKSLCSNCRNQMTGFDGGFFGLPFTCECRIYGETEGRKNCSKFKKRITKSDLLNKIQSLEKENEQLQKEIKRLKCMNNQLERRLDYSIAYDMRECE